MTLREVVLDSLADDIETIVQIMEYLNYLGVQYTKEQLIEELDLLYLGGYIEIVYPKEVNISTLRNFEVIEDLWFDMTESGRQEWGIINN
ncbi:MAG: hypothetical protein ACM3MK_14415 [Chitinophagales bacterium]